MGAPRDFDTFKKRGMAGMNVPIVGQRLPESQIRDALGRVLKEGDFIILQTPNEQPFRVQELKVVQEPGMPPVMQIKLTSTTFFLSQMDVPNTEFMRVMTNDEVKERQAQGQEGVSVDRPDAKPTDGSAAPADSETPPQTLGDA